MKNKAIEENETVKHRLPLRLKDFDYTTPGGYFVTLCTFGKKCLFGQIGEGEMNLNEYGEIVRACWLNLPAHYSNVILDAWIIMPNHFHGVILLTETEKSHLGKPPKKNSLSEIVRCLKTSSARRINRLCNTPGQSLWQRGFYDHIIRNEKELEKIVKYIIQNPLRWEFDSENPDGKQDKNAKKFDNF